MTPLHQCPTQRTRAQDGPPRGNISQLIEPTPDAKHQTPIPSVRVRTRNTRALNGSGREERLLLSLLRLLVLLVLRRLRRRGRLSCRGVWIDGISNELR